MYKLSGSAIVKGEKGRGGALWLLLRFDNMTHKDGVAGIGDDEEEEWVIHVESWWATL